jgi:glycolate dehydrogenase FAD-binding subunit
MDAAVSATANRVTSVLEEGLRAIVTPQYMRQASAADSVAGALPRLVVEPGTERELAKVLKLADDAGLAVIPLGGGTKREWGNPPGRADLILSTTRLNRILEHAWADLTVTVEAGCTIAELQGTLAKRGQRLALDALWPEHATVGGVLSTNDSGALRLRFGSLRDLIIGVTLALPDGTLASSGGKVVKNVAGYDLPKLATGALGTLGVITRAVFRVHPLPKETCSLTCICDDVAEAQRLVLAVQDSKLAHSALQIRCDGKPQSQVDVLFEATQAGLVAQTKQLKSLTGNKTFGDSTSDVWNIRQTLYSATKQDGANCAIAKFSTLPAQLANTIEALATLCADRVRWSTVVQATGIGCVRLEGEGRTMESALLSLRKDLEGTGGSLAVHHSPLTVSRLEAWGGGGDALPLMRAVKQQFDPRNTLNPGRFVGGI